MASWIVHLRIADKLLEEIDGLDPAQFSIGNVAPDSGRPDEKWENFDPPVEVTHFHTPESAGKFMNLEDLRFYRGYLEEISIEDGREKFSFLLGYFFHLVTDNFWFTRVGKVTRERFQEEYDRDPDFIWEVKKDWYGLDFAHVRSHPESLFWRVFLEARYQQEYLDFFPQGAISEKLDYIRDFYQRTDEDIENNLRLTKNLYLTTEEMDRFIDGAVHDLALIYRAIWERGASVDGMLSAVEIML